MQPARPKLTIKTLKDWAENLRLSPNEMVQKSKEEYDEPLTRSDVHEALISLGYKIESFSMPVNQCHNASSIANINIKSPPKRHKNRFFTLEEVEEIINLYMVEKKSSITIAEIFTKNKRKVSCMTVLRELHELAGKDDRVKIRPKGQQKGKSLQRCFSKEVLETVERLTLAGDTRLIISEKLKQDGIDASMQAISAMQKAKKVFPLTKRGPKPKDKSNDQQMGIIMPISHERRAHHRQFSRDWLGNLPRTRFSRNNLSPKIG